MGDRGNVSDRSVKAAVPLSLAAEAHVAALKLQDLQRRDQWRRDRDELVGLLRSANHDGTADAERLADAVLAGGWRLARVREDQR